LDAEGRLIFNPPHNIFQLRNHENPTDTQVVRLICLQPPPPDYTFTKQQNDTPAIHLHLEYLDPTTYQPMAKEAYPFPVCMYEGNTLDRYRWEVSTLILAPEPSARSEASTPALVGEPVSSTDSIPSPLLEPSVTQQGSTLSTIPVLFESTEFVSTPLPQATGDRTVDDAEPIVSKPPRRVIELPMTKSLIFYWVNASDSDTILKRIRLWAAWSEKAMPQSRWEVVQSGSEYTLMNARFNRRILRISLDHASITLENSLPVLMKWFHDLGLAVSQTQNQRQYSSTQVTLARNLFVNMSLPQNDPLIVLKKLFGVEFSKTAVY
jgi:hypothetical protein